MLARIDVEVADSRARELIHLDVLRSCLLLEARESFARRFLHVQIRMTELALSLSDVQARLVRLLLHILNVIFKFILNRIHFGGVVVSFLGEVLELAQLFRL